MDGHRLLLRVQEAADACGLSRSAAYEAIRRGEIPHIRVGHAIRVPLRALQRLIDEKAATAESGEG